MKLRREAAARVELARLEAEQHHKESEKIQKRAQMRSEAREKAAAAKDAAKRREEERIQNEINELKQQQALADEKLRAADVAGSSRSESSGGETRGGDENGRANGCVEEEEASRDR